MVAVDIAALLYLCKGKCTRNWLNAMFFAGTVAILAACVMEKNHFGVARLGAWGLFLHGSLLLVASAVVFWWRGKRRGATGLIVCAAVLSSICLDAFVIEPNWLEVSRVRITSDKISRPVRIVVLADLQTDRLGDYERMVLRRVLSEKPDIILLAGDYLQAPCGQRGELAEQFNEYLREIGFTAPEGVFAVQGNVDGGRWWDVFDGLDIQAVSQRESFDVAGLRLSCLSLTDSGNTGLYLPNDTPDRFHVVLGHKPDYALGIIEADLMVSGHTHGGQVRIPLFGPVITHSRIPHAWAAGLTDLSDGSKLLVSRGVGMERQRAPRMRFFCRPELVVIELSPPK